MTGHEFLYLPISILGISVFGLFAHRFNQPLLIGYIAAGIFLNEIGFQKYVDAEQMEIFSKLGLTLLLFIVGLKLDISVIKNMGNSFKIGVAQIFITALLGFCIAFFMKFGVMSSVYIAMALTFSSTIVIIKILSDKGELDSLYGRLNLGVLILQDIAAIVFMIILPCFSKEGNQSVTQSLLDMAKYGILTALIIFATVRFIFPRYLSNWAKSPELLMVISLGFAILLAYICEMGGLSMEVGAFLAGTALAPFKEYRYTISSKLIGLRDFMLIYFFLNLGISFDLNSIKAVIYQAVIFIIFVLFIKPFIIMFIMEKIGYQKRTAFMSGTSLAQISEFSIILMTFGMSVNQVGKNVPEMITVVLMVTILVSSYYMNYAQELYRILSKNIRIWKNSKTRFTATEDTEYEIKAPYDTIIIGIGNFGSALAGRLEEKGFKVLEIDFDPVIVAERHNAGKNIIYGDAEDFDMLAQLNVAHVKWVISNIQMPNVNKVLIRSLKILRYRGCIAASSFLECSEELKNTKGLDVIFEPYTSAVNEAVSIMGSYKK